MKCAHITDNELGLLAWPVEAEEECRERATWPQAAAKTLHLQITDSLGTEVGEEHIMYGHKSECLN